MRAVLPSLTAAESEALFSADRMTRGGESPDAILND